MTLFTFSLYGIPVEVKLGVVVFVTWLYLAGVRPYLGKSGQIKLFSFWAFVGVLLLLLTQIVHEATHAYFAQMYGGAEVVYAGIDIRRIYVLLDLNLSEITPYQYIIIHGISPLVNLAVAIFLTFWVWIAGESLPENTLQYVARANAYLFLFHILPLSFTDGGKVVAGVIWWITKDPRLAEMIVMTAGNLAGAVIFLLITRKLRKRTDKILSDL